MLSSFVMNITFFFTNSLISYVKSVLVESSFVISLISKITSSIDISEILVIIFCLKTSISSLNFGKAVISFTVFVKIEFVRYSVSISIKILTISFANFFLLTNISKGLFNDNNFLIIAAGKCLIKLFISSFFVAIFSR